MIDGVIRDHKRASADLFVLVQAGETSGDPPRHRGRQSCQ